MTRGGEDTGGEVEGAGDGTGDVGAGGGEEFVGASKGWAVGGCVVRVADTGYPDDGGMGCAEDIEGAGPVSWGIAYG